MEGVSKWGGQAAVRPQRGCRRGYNSLPCKALNYCHRNCQKETLHKLTH